MILKPISNKVGLLVYSALLELTNRLALINPLIAIMLKWRPLRVLLS